MPSKSCYKNTSIVCFIISAIILIVGLTVFFVVFRPYLDDFVNDEIISNSIVVDNTDEGYPDWQTNTGDLPPFYTYTYFFNLTNVDDVLNGSYPIFQELGPFVYKENRTKIDIVFLEDRTKVEWREFRQFFFVPELSFMNDDVEIVSLNPGYLGVCTQSGGEEPMTIALSGPVLLRVFQNWMYNSFVNHLKIDYLNPILIDAESKFDINDFYSSWANRTDDGENNIYKGMHISTVESGASEISLEITKQLFNTKVDYSFVSDSTNMIWYNASKTESQSIEQTDAIYRLQSTFQLSLNQLTLIINWLNSDDFNQTWLWPYFASNFKIENEQDLAFLQWGSASATKKQNHKTTSVYNLYWDYPYPGVPEYGYDCQAPFCSTIDYATSKYLLNDPTYGIFDMTNMGNFLIYSSDKLAIMYNLTDKQVLILKKYIFSFSKIYSFFFLNEYIFPAGGTLFTKHSVNYWLFNGTDALLQYASPSMPGIPILINDSSIEDSKKRPVNTLYTGKSSQDLVSWYISYLGHDTLDYYAEPIPVAGTDDWGQFPPFLTEEDNKQLYSFSSDYYRTVPIFLNSTYEDEYGIKLFRYLINDSFFGIDPLYYQSIQGFVNASGAYNATPIFLSNPHFYGVLDQQWINKTTGIVQNILNDTTIIDIEPNTGKVFNVQESLQVNVFLNVSKHFFSVFNPDVVNDVFFPSGWLSEISQAREKDAGLIKDIYIGQGMSKFGYWIVVGVALITLILTVTFFFCSNKNKQVYELQ
eukprot:TRINITY_DN821_c0_g8_i1.p1 TRINITY_DN821_c0_g8~~TRINITY_DN821_c0_g8_i1.p1  ORF type:complete len:755 (+),score=264.24 TRINITY_DN821_c0_g8_i1:89-2353(+)